MKPESRDLLHLSLIREEDRLKTFDNWPVSFIDKNVMAAIGFYSLNEKDLVRCVACGVELGHWEEGDVPIEEHKRWSPSCPYLKGLVGNNDENNESRVARPQAFDVTGVYNLDMHPNSGLENGMKANDLNQRSGPQYYSFMSINARLKSFESWPKHVKPTPEELSAAGFFYSGTSDRTICFFCGGGLSNWKATDDPWMEHCKWFPHCSYVIMNKSKEFIERSLAKE